MDLQAFHVFLQYPQLPGVISEFRTWEKVNLSSRLVELTDPSSKMDAIRHSDY